ncbi:unnamed protein product [Meloidogyne enterolobii]|uniref:Uncharacterized protein n=1 Tax=Meloidogyne enterolobii TaxID=390850 RepID=A0ACB0Y765_MELEN
MYFILLIICLLLKKEQAVNKKKPWKKRIGRIKKNKIDENQKWVRAIWTRKSLKMHKIFFLETFKKESEEGGGEGREGEEGMGNKSRK